jgi:hypothetical protein
MQTWGGVEDPKYNQTQENLQISNYGSHRKAASSGLSYEPIPNSRLPASKEATRQTYLVPRDFTGRGLWLAETRIQHARRLVA